MKRKWEYTAPGMRMGCHLTHSRNLHDKSNIVNHSNNFQNLHEMDFLYKIYDQNILRNSKIIF